MKILVLQEVSGCRECPHLFISSGDGTAFGCKSMEILEAIWTMDPGRFNRMRGAVVTRSRIGMDPAWIHPKCPFKPPDPVPFG